MGGVILSDVDAQKALETKSIEAEDFTLVDQDNR
jgi:hypothetical protein